jgi:hypothetical protein
VKLALFALIALVVSCASTPPVTSTSGEARDTWSGQSFVDKHETMTFTVLPNMGRAFARFRGDDVPKLRCASCHGENAEDVHYRMPNNAVRALDPTHLPRDGDWAKFMIDDVMPAMKEMTGDSRITCFTCHARESP